MNERDKRQEEKQFRNRNADERESFDVCCAMLTYYRIPLSPHQRQVTIQQMTPKCFASTVLVSICSAHRLPFISIGCRSHLFPPYYFFIFVHLFLFIVDLMRLETKTIFNGLFFSSLFSIFFLGSSTSMSVRLISFGCKVLSTWNKPDSSVRLRALFISTNVFYIIFFAPLSFFFLTLFSEFFNFFSTRTLFHFICSHCSRNECSNEYVHILRTNTRHLPFSLCYFEC